MTTTQAPFGPVSFCSSPCTAPSPSLDDQHVRLSEVVSALSCALDITEGQPEGHSARSTLIGMRIAQELGLSSADQDALFYAILLKDLGCSSNAAKMAYLFGADDGRLKRDAKTIDWTRMMEVARYLKSHVAPGAQLWERAMRFASLAVQGPQGPKQLVQTRCERGSAVARDMGFPEATALAIRHLDEHWNGQGHPNGLRQTEISLLGRIAGLAQTVEVFVRDQGVDAAYTMAHHRRSRWFDPDLVTALDSIRHDQAFWNQVVNDHPLAALEPFEPQDTIIYADERRLDKIAEGFARVVDAKSPWTFKHSTNVSFIACGIAEAVGLDTNEVRHVRRMSMLHDLGKLGVSNMILDKPGRLTESEFAALRAHPESSERIVSRIGCLAEYARLTGSHHERLDGRGYHRGVPSGELPLAARLLTVADIFEALTASRPYRDAMPREKALDILKKDAGVAVCPTAVEGLLTFLNSTPVAPRVKDQLESLDRLLCDLSRPA